MTICILELASYFQESFLKLMIHFLQMFMLLVVITFSIDDNILNKSFTHPTLFVVGINIQRGYPCNPIRAEFARKHFSCSWIFEAPGSRKPCCNSVVKFSHSS